MRKAIMSCSKICTISDYIDKNILTRALTRIAFGRKPMDMRSTIRDNFQEILAVAVEATKMVPVVSGQQPFYKKFTIYRSWGSANNNFYSIYTIHDNPFTGSTLYFGNVMTDSTEK